MNLAEVGDLVGVTKNWPWDEMGPVTWSHMGFLSSFFTLYLLSAVPGTVWEVKASLARRILF